MRKVTITSDCLIPAGGEAGVMKTAFTGSVLELDDPVAVALIAAQRAEAAADDAKVVDLAAKRERAQRAAAADGGQGSLT